MGLSDLYASAVMDACSDALAALSGIALTPTETASTETDGIMRKDAVYIGTTSEVNAPDQGQIDLKDKLVLFSVGHGDHGRGRGQGAQNIAASPEPLATSQPSSSGDHQPSSDDSPLPSTVGAPPDLPPVALGQLSIRNGRVGVLMYGDWEPRWFEFVGGALEIGRGYRDLELAVSGDAHERPKEQVGQRLGGVVGRAEWKIKNGILEFALHGTIWMVQWLMDMK